MKYTNMKQWLDDLRAAPNKKPLPILSFPCISLLGITVRELISDSERQAEGMRLVAANTDAAASVSLMDLSVEAECFGAEIRVSDSEVPTVVGRLVHDEDEAEALAVPPVGSARSGLYIDAIRRAVTMIEDRPVFAGMIGPFSLAARLLDVSEIMMDCYDDPDMVHVVLRKATAFLIEYARAYKAVGAGGIMMAEPVAGLLSPALEAEFSAPYVKQIVDAVQDDSFLLIYHNCGDNTVAMIDSILSTGSAAYHFGNAIDLRTMLEKVPADTVVMGNVDPAAEFRMGTPASIRLATFDVLEKCSSFPNFVLSSGCDIPPMTAWENINAFFAAAKEYDAR
ncbi:MAG: uroporphyrinogen decarboxylase family protein [Clostridia bacterium]|nr:uroporphyrinogen decarboxylase family protein [Clostridia bacterium]